MLLLGIVATPRQAVKTKTCRTPLSARNDPIGFHDCHGRWRQQLGVQGKPLGQPCKSKVLQTDRALCYDFTWFDLLFETQTWVQFSYQLGKSSCCMLNLEPSWPWGTGTHQIASGRQCNFWVATSSGNKGKQIWLKVQISLGFVTTIRIFSQGNLIRYKRRDVQWFHTSFKTHGTTWYLHIFQIQDDISSLNWRIPWNNFQDRPSIPTLVTMAICRTNPNYISAKNRHMWNCPDLIKEENVFLGHIFQIPIGTHLYHCVFSQVTPVTDL